MVTVAENKLIDVFKEHCSFCPASMVTVARALISVEEDLDYDTKYSLEYLIGRYATAYGKLNPNGFSAVLDQLPIEDIEDTIQMAQSIDNSMSELHSLIKEKTKESILTDVESLIRHNLEIFSKVLPNAFEKSKTIIKDASVRESELNRFDKKVLKADGLDTLYATSSLIRETVHEGKQGSIYRARLIQEGLSASGTMYPGSVLKEATHLFNDARAYMNHPDLNFQGGERPVQDMVGFYTDAEYIEGDGIYADFHVLANSGFPFLANQLHELAEANKLDLIGLSLLGLGKSSMKKIDGNIIRQAESINFVRSIDVVDLPGAGGVVLENIRESQSRKVMEEAMDVIELTLKDLTPEKLAQLKESDPEQYEKFQKLFIEAAHPNETDDEKKKRLEKEKADKMKESVSPAGEKVEVTTVRETVPGKDTEAQTQMREAVTELKIERLDIKLDKKIETSNLPKPMRESIKAQFVNTLWDEKDLDAQIKTYRETAAELADIQLPVTPTGIVIGNTEEETLQASMDRLFGLDVEEKFKNVPKFSGIREAYVAITGDYQMTWGAVPLSDRFREGAGVLPTATKVVGGGTITFANVLGTSINRRLVKRYAAQTMWWKPVVNIVELANLKQQDRNKLKSLGSLTERTTGGTEYAELTWAENLETYTPTEFGNIVPIAQRAIVNDDLNSLVSVADELGRSSGITLNEYVSNLFTQNSGTGPALADTNKVFDNANHQANTDANTLNRTNLAIADKVIRKMTDDSSKRIGLIPRYILGPPDLREIMFQLTASPQVPESANNARNLFENDDITPISVPNWTDVNNWYLMTSPDQLDLLEMGFLMGRQEPELFVQADPAVGMPFSHDVIAYKIRHRFGGDWLDFRGAYAGLPA